MTKPLKEFECLATDEKRRLVLSSIARANPGSPVGPHINGRVPDETKEKSRFVLHQKLARLFGRVGEKVIATTLIVLVATILRFNSKRFAIAITALMGVTVANFWSPGFNEKIELTSLCAVVAIAPFLKERFFSWMAGSTSAAILTTWVSFLLSDCPGKFGNGFGWNTLIILIMVSSIVGFISGILTWFIARSARSFLQPSNIPCPPFQYSLRQGMIQIAVIGVLLAITNIRVGNRYSRSVSELEASGFSMFFDCWGNPTTVWALGPAVSDADLVLLAKIPTVRSLGLVASSVTDNGIAHLSILPNLRSVRLPTQITDVGIASLISARSLRYVDAMGCQLTPTGCRNLLKLPHIETIRIHPNKIGALQSMSGFDGIEVTTRVSDE